MTNIKQLRKTNYKDVSKPAGSCTNRYLLRT